jgi:selenide,water dikinase
MKKIAPAADPALMLGFDTSDDAAVYKLDDQTAAVLTLDFFTPVVDDPYEFGAIAAANALSDVFAMGGKPLTALNILAFSCSLGTDVVAEVMRGGSDKVREAGAFVVGGHSVDDDEPKYGLSVFGVVHPDRIVRNEGACAGDVLFYTKQLGTGILNSAFRAGLETDESMRPAIESMMELNRAGAEAMLEAGVHAATDVTGFGLAGHLHEMLEASGVGARLCWDALPLFDRVWDYSCAYCRPGKSFQIIDWARAFVKQGTLDDAEYDNRMGVLCDPQTSGGLLVAIPPEQADTFTREFESRTGRIPARIGEVVDAPAGLIFMR